MQRQKKLWKIENDIIKKIFQSPSSVNPVFYPQSTTQRSTEGFANIWNIYRLKFFLFVDCESVPFSPDTLVSKKKSYGKFSESFFICILSIFVNLSYPEFIKDVKAELLTWEWKKGANC
jgi:hypothetical protein